MKLAAHGIDNEDGEVKEGNGVMNDLDILSTPARIGRLKLKNRFIQSPLHSKFASDFGEVSPKMTDYLVRRARGGVSMIILENTAVNWEEGRAAGNPVRIDDDRFISGLSDLTEAVHREGVLISTQLHHAGRQNPTANTDGRVGPVAPSPIASTAIGDTPRELSVPEIEAIVVEQNVVDWVQSKARVTDRELAFEELMAAS